MHKQGVGEFPFYCGINSLSELATKDDRCVVLNILGKESSGVTPISHDYSGGNIVFGTGPGKSGKSLATKTGKIPVYNSIKEGLEAGHKFNTVVIYLPFRCERWTRRSCTRQSRSHQSHYPHRESLDKRFSYHAGNLSGQWGGSVWR